MFIVLLSLHLQTDVIHELRPRSMDGVVDSGVSLNGDNGCGSDVGESQQVCNDDTIPVTYLMTIENYPLIVEEK